MGNKHFLLFATVVVALLVVGCDSAEAPSNDAEQIADSAVIEQGATVYAANCASCHGVNLEGQADWQTPNPDGTWKAPPHDESGHTWHHPDEYLLDRIVNGTNGLDATMQAKSNMPAYGETLDNAEIEAVLAFIKTHWSPSIQEMQRQR